jgi:hypothetical protein
LQQLKSTTEQILEMRMRMQEQQMQARLMEQMESMEERREQREERLERHQMMREQHGAFFTTASASYCLSNRSVLSFSVPAE